MGDTPPVKALTAPFIHIPSNQMVIRRYRNLNERNIRSFFEKGLYCRNITKFNDNNEGLVEQAAEDPAMRSAAVVTASHMRRRRDLPELELDSDEFRERMTELHRLSRMKYFANCWRLGTEELDRVWKTYTKDEDMVEGFAFETTVGGFIQALPTRPDDLNPEEEESNGVKPRETPIDEMYIGKPSTDMHVGAVRYQDRQMPGAVQPAGYQSAVNFFKGSGYDYELEFRFLFNPFDSANMIQFDMDARPVNHLPHTISEFYYFPMDTREMVDRIVLAPNAGEEERNRIEEILDNIGISYGADEDDDLEIVESNSRGEPLPERRNYTAEFGGTDNYEQSEEYLERIRTEFLEETDKDNWPAIDAVELFEERAGVVIENYRHARAEPEFDIESFGHDEYQAVIVNRLFADGEPEQYRNKEAEERFGKSNENRER